MPSLDRIWRLFATGSGESVTVWAGQSFASGLAVIGQQVDRGGVLYSPLSTVVIRIRWRPDVSIDSRWVDSRGRVWRTNEVADVGRFKFLDASVSTYDLPGEAVAPDTQPGDASFIPPAGWYLQYRNGASVRDIFDPPRFVSHLTIGAVGEVFVLGQSISIFNVLVPSGGWAVAAGQDTWIDDGIDATIQGGESSFDGFSVGVLEPNPSWRTVVANVFTAGTEFPTADQSHIHASGSGFGTPRISAGLIIRITPGA